MKQGKGFIQILTATVITFYNFEIQIFKQNLLISFLVLQKLLN